MLKYFVSIRKWLCGPRHRIESVTAEVSVENEEGMFAYPHAWLTISDGGRHVTLDFDFRNAGQLRRSVRGLTIIRDTVQSMIDALPAAHEHFVVVDAQARAKRKAVRESEDESC